jgi:hypothetical protein
MYFLGAQAFGCETFKESQAKACECRAHRTLPPKENDEL